MAIAMPGRTTARKSPPSSKGEVSFMDWDVAMFVLGLMTLGMMFAFVTACERV